VLHQEFQDRETLCTLCLNRFENAKKSKYFSNLFYYASVAKQKLTENKRCEAKGKEE